MMILVTGGSASGKSGYAEQLMLQSGEPRVYIATMRVFSDEDRKRVSRHKELRAGKGFDVVECSENMDQLQLAPEQRGGTILLECLGDLVANEMYAPPTWDLVPVEQVERKVAGAVENLASQCETLIVVTNEVGSDGTDYQQETKDYVNLVGKIGCVLAGKADTVVEYVSGVANVLKGGRS